MNSFIRAYKKQLLFEFEMQDKNGLYSYTQKLMAYNSNRIEGSTLTSEQTASLFDTGTIISSEGFIYRAKDVEEMTGHFKMFNELLKQIDNPLSEEMIKSFHYQLKSGVFEGYANGYPVGEYKKWANQVSDITTELPKNISQKMNKLISDYNKTDKSIEDIAVFHAEYERIHPFQYGNGRTGRAVIFKQCLDSDIIPIIINNTDKAVYQTALHQAQTEEKYNALIDVFKASQEKYYTAVKDFIHDIPQNHISVPPRTRGR